MEIIILTRRDLQDIEQKLDSILKRLEELEPEPIKSPESYLTRKQVKEMLQITYPTLHKWSNEGWLPYSKLGRKVLFKSSDVESLISRNSR